MFRGVGFYIEVCYVVCFSVVSSFARMISADPQGFVYPTHYFKALLFSVVKRFSVLDVSLFCFDFDGIRTQGFDRERGCCCKKKIIVFPA